MYNLAQVMCVSITLWLKLYSTHRESTPKTCHTPIKHSTTLLSWSHTVRSLEERKSQPLRSGDLCCGITAVPLMLLA